MGWSRARRLLGRIKVFFAPDELLPDGNPDGAIIRRRTVRVVGTIIGVSVLTFAPSLLIVGFPKDRSVGAIAAVAATATLIGISLLAVRPHTSLAIITGAANAFAVAGLAILIGDYYHQGGLLFALVVAGIRSSTEHGRPS